MGEALRIIVADRNRRVRELLRRELAAEGFQVQEARDGLEVWALFNDKGLPDLLILDLEIPYLEELTRLARLNDEKPPLPLIAFADPADDLGDRSVLHNATLLEHKEDVDRLKAVVTEVIARFYSP